MPPHGQSSTPDTCCRRLSSILSLSLPAPLDAGGFLSKLQLSLKSLADFNDRFDCFVNVHAASQYD
jgi:hypothetical protein